MPPIFTVAGIKVAVVVSVVEPAGITHVPLPLQTPPFHPANNDPVIAIGVSVTGDVISNWFAQVPEVQLIPAGLLDTVPEPVPLTDTLTVRVTGKLLKVAVTVVSVLRAITHVPVPLQPPPLQPAKSEPAAGEGVSVMVAGGNVFIQVPDAQFTPAGLLVTEPVPGPAICTVNLGLFWGLLSVMLTSFTLLGADTETGA